MRRNGDTLYIKEGGLAKIQYVWRLGGGWQPYSTEGVAMANPRWDSNRITFSNQCASGTGCAKDAWFQTRHMSSNEKFVLTCISPSGMKVHFTYCRAGLPQHTHDDTTF